jgi:hypothetical protein
MSEDAKHMDMRLPEGAAVILQWPENVSTEDLEMIEQVLTIQLRSVRHAIERRKAADQIPLGLPEPVAAGADEQEGEQPAINKGEKE